MNRRNAWIVLAAAVIIALPVRLYQVFSLAEGSTGFYRDGNRTTVIVLAILALGVLLSGAMNYFDKNGRTAGHTVHSVPAAVFGIFTGLGLATQSVVSLAMDGGPYRIMYMILSLFGILAGIVLVITAYDFATGQDHFESHPLPALVPPLWGCACLVTLFVSYVSVVNTADNIFNIFTVIFLLLFFFSQAKLLARIDEEKSGRLIYVFGLPAALLSLVTGVTGSAVMFSGVQRGGFFPTGLHPVVLIMAFYILSFLAAYSGGPVPQEEPPREEEPEAADLEKSDLEECSRLLAEEYNGTVGFFEREKSPFLPNKI